MVVNINKETIKKIREIGMSEKAFLILFSLFKNEEIYPENEINVYITIQWLIINGYVIEDFSESDTLFKLTIKGEEFIETIENQ